jgi:hypothetical protein
MPQDPQIVERPNPVEPAAPAAEPAPDVIEAKVKERLKTDFGVDDAEEIKRWRAEADEGRQYKGAFEELQRRLAPQQQRPQPQYQPPRQGPPNIAQLREYARIDPLGAYLEIEKYKEAHNSQRMQALEQKTFGALAQREYATQEERAETYVRAEYPEAYDQRTALHREGKAVYQSMPELQRRGDGFQIATEIAAGRLGLAPKSRRPAPPDKDDMAAQTLERGTKKPPRGDAKDDGVTLNAREKKMLASGGIDEKTFKAAKAARKAGKDIRVN